MKLSKNGIIVSVVSIVILLVSLVLTLLDVFVPLDLWTHPILTFLFCIFSGFGLLCLVLGYSKKTAWYVFLGAILFSLAVLYVLLHYVFVWLAILICVVMVAILSVCNLIRSGSKTEFALNESESYQDYKQRKAEKKALQEQEAKEELPEIKSFK